MSKLESALQTATGYLLDAGKVELARHSKDHNFTPDKGQASVVEKSNKTLTIIVPSEMNKLQAAYNLMKQFEEEETLRTYNMSYANFFLNDFMVTMGALIPKYFGMLHVSKINTGGGPAHQDYLQVPIGYNADGSVKNEKGYVGSILAPVWENAILDIFPGGIAVRAKMKFEEEVLNFLADIETSIKTNSIVKGNCVSVAQHPRGLLASPIMVKENPHIVLSEDVNRLVNNLVIPSLKEKSKTSLLFTGDFGTGKTETALKVGAAAKKRYGRTFFYLQNSDMFTPLIPYIKNYQPCLVFVEDVDQISSGDRDSSMNDLLNQLDGNELKNVDCTFIFTTNNHDKIHPAMRRPGRIDQVVHFGYCTVESIAKIFEAYAIGMKGAEGVDYLEAAKACPENLQGAVVAEIARRAVKYSEHIHDGEISTDRFLDAIASMKYHIEFMRNEQKVDHTAENLLGHLLYKGMKKAFPQIDIAPTYGANPFADSGFAGLDS